MYWYIALLIVLSVAIPIMLILIVGTLNLISSNRRATFKKEKDLSKIYDIKNTKGDDK